jgi:DUF4097 and DUF4098 domain-containing protein YvlB
MKEELSRGEIVMNRYVAVAMFALVVALPGCISLSGCGGAHERVNGSVSVRSGEQAQDVSTVNGAIRIEEDATVREASTVNGSIELGARSKASSLETVNGGISLGEGAQVARGIETVNGSVSLDKSVHIARGVSAVNGAVSLDSGAEVGGRVENVNGHIQLTAAHIGGGIQTASGSIDIGANSRVEGGIVVEKSHGMHFGKPAVPRVVIGPGAVVQGTLRFERQVKLYVSDSATIGPVEGAVPERFAGDHPPE